MPEGYFPSSDFREFLYQIQRGQVTGYTYEERNIFCPEISTTYFSTVWSVSPPSMYNYLTAAQVLQVSSASTLDTAAGVGCRTILIRGLDANYDPISEIVTLNGQTPVNTVNSYFRVLNMDGQTFGSDRRNRGAIYAGSGIVTAGVNSVTHGHINMNSIFSTMGIYTVPRGYTLISFDAKYSVGAGKQATLRAVVRGAPSQPFVQRNVRNLFSGPSTPDFDITTNTIPERADIEIQGRGNVGNTAVIGNFQLALVDNSYV